MLGVSRAWLYDAAKDGRVPCVRSRAVRLAALARDALLEGERFGLCLERRTLGAVIAPADHPCAAVGGRTLTALPPG
jgi:hypothetical protein